MWIIKVAIGLLVAFILRLLVSSGFFNFISYVSVWMANWVYVFIALVFIDLVYTFNISLDEKAKEDKKCHILKAVLAIIMLLGAIIFCYYSFYQNLIWVSWVNVGCLVIFLGIAALRVFPENSIMVAAYIGACIILISFFIHSKGAEEEPL